MPENAPRNDLTAGICAGAANTLVGFPFDTLKVRLQAERGVYRGAWHCLVHILKYEGVGIDVSSFGIRRSGSSWTLSRTDATSHRRCFGNRCELFRKVYFPSKGRNLPL